MSLQKEDVRAIAAGTHPDPFAYLGPHAGKGSTVVRAFRPGATAVTAVSPEGAALTELKQIHPEGLFEGTLAGEETPYRLRISYPLAEVEQGDPYRFPPLLPDYDLYLFGEGNHNRLYRQLGAHLIEAEGVEGVRFAVWAPSATRVSVVGEFNTWDGRVNPMRRRDGGVWELFIPGLQQGEVYKYEILGPDGSLQPLKADPFGFYAEQSPGNASIVWDIGAYEWSDTEWMASGRGGANALDAPMSTYEVHLGSWRRRQDGSRLSYRELAEELVPYVSQMGYTHVEFMPPTEHPFEGSWGYQPVGLYAPTSRFGPPEDFKLLVDAFHREGIAVVMDWVPAHFPEDPHGLAYFDGTHLYEHADPRQGRHPDWNTRVFNYGRNEVSNYLISNAVFWLSEYHIDALRVDAVASMLYLDYSRGEGEWIPNEYGGNENLEAISFIKRANELAYAENEGIATIAEESTSWPMVSRPTYLGGLGFGYKWNMGWMHDTLEYMRHDPIHRSYHHNNLSFGLIYAFSENFILPLSHDEVVHGKGSLLGKMPGDEWQRFANLRAYYAFMYAHPGKQLLFMGAELAQDSEWNHDAQLEWHLLEHPLHRGVSDLIEHLNRLHKEEGALHQLDFSSEGFEWIEGGDTKNSTLSFIRRGNDPRDTLVAIFNFTPVVHKGYRVGVPIAGEYRELLNTDAPGYGGSGVSNAELRTTDEPSHGRPHSLSLRLPPLGALFLKPAL